MIYNIYVMKDGLVLPGEYITALRLKGFTESEAYEELDGLATRQGFEHILGLIEDIIDRVYAERWGGRPQRRLRGSHTKAEWEAKKAQYNNCCFYCCKKTKRLTKDHIIPIVRGGSNRIDNILPACMRCNLKKSITPLEEFQQGAMLKLV